MGFIIRSSTKVVASDSGGSRMGGQNTVQTRLIDVADCCVVVVDVQSVFVEKLRQETQVAFIKRVAWIVTVATKLGIPSVVTAEDIQKNGTIIPELAAALPPDTFVHNKMVFSLAADPVIFDAVLRTGKRVAVILGLETDVCVAQSALGLLERELQVVAVRDACDSPGDGHLNGLNRMENAGVLLSDVKSLFYEWMRTLAACRSFYSQFEGEIGDPDEFL